MVYDDGVEFWIYLASRIVHRQGEFCLRSIDRNHECDIVRRVFKLCVDGCCVFLHLRSLTSEADAMLLIQFGGLRVIILLPHLFDGLYATVNPAKILLSSLKSLDQVKKSGIIAVQRMLIQSPLLAIEDQLVISFIKFLPQLKKETSFFSCWVLHYARYASPGSVFGVVFLALLLLLCASVLPHVSFTACIFSHADIFNMKLLLHTALSRFLSNHEEFKPATSQFTLLRFVLVLLDVQQLLKQFQFSLKSSQLQEGAAVHVSNPLLSVSNTWILLGYLIIPVMLNANNEDYASPWFLDFSESRELVVRLTTLREDMKKTTVLHCDTLSVFRCLPMLLELPYGSSPRPPDDHASESSIYTPIHFK